MKRNLSDADIRLLNHLKVNKPDSYRRKLRILGLDDSDVPTVFVTDYSSFYKIQHQNNNQENYSYDPYKYSWEWTDDDYEQMDDYSGYDDEYDYNDSYNNQIHNLYLIDGDNHITEALERISLADETDDVRIFVCQETKYKKLVAKRYPFVQVIKVKPGNQAVDNQIKSVLGNAVKCNYYTDIFVISHDKGYEPILQKYRSRYGKRKNHLDRRERF